MTYLEIKTRHDATVLAQALNLCHAAREEEVPIVDEHTNYNTHRLWALYPEGVELLGILTCVAEPDGKWPAVWGFCAYCPSVAEFLDASPTWEEATTRSEQILSEIMAK